MKKKYNVEEFLNDAVLNIEKAELTSKFPDMFYSSYFEGNRDISQKQEILSKRFDIKWIETIESYINSLNIIARTVKSNLKNETEVVPVELARNISSESVVHLTRHTENIKEINNGLVIPNKILTNISEIEYGIYENRFIMTLILRLRDFTSERIKIIKENLSTTKIIDFNFNSDFIYEEANYKVEVKINQEETSGINDITEYNNKIYDRAQKLMSLINRLYKSPFMGLMKGYNKVVPPIMKTQVILKNPHFKNAYLLWLYLDKNQSFGYDIENTNHDMTITNDYENAINKTILLMFSNLLNHDGDEDDGTAAVKPINIVKTKANITNYSQPIIEFIDQNIDIEDVGLNEYFINKAKEVFQKQINIDVEEGLEYHVSLQKALRDATEITNALYASFFEINSEEDIFRKLVKSEDPVLAYSDVNKKYDVSKLIRKEKERDYLNAIELEKKWAKELGLRQEKLLEYEENTVDEIVSKFIKEKQEEFDLANNDYEKDLANARKKLIDDNNLQSDSNYNNLKDHLYSERERLKHLAKTRTEEALEQLKLLQEDKQRKIRVLDEVKKVEDEYKFNLDNDMNTNYGNDLFEYQSNQEYEKINQKIKNAELEIQKLNQDINNAYESLDNNKKINNQALNKLNQLEEVKQRKLKSLAEIQKEEHEINNQSSSIDAEEVNKKILNTELEIQRLDQEINATNLNINNKKRYSEEPLNRLSLLQAEEQKRHQLLSGINRVDSSYHLNNFQSYIAPNYNQELYESQLNLGDVEINEQIRLAELELMRLNTAVNHAFDSLRNTASSNEESLLKLKQLQEESRKRIQLLNELKRLEDGYRYNNLNINRPSIFQQSISNNIPVFNSTDVVNPSPMIKPTPVDNPTPVVYPQPVSKSEPVTNPQPIEKLKSADSSQNKSQNSEINELENVEFKLKKINKEVNDAFNSLKTTASKTKETLSQLKLIEEQEQKNLKLLSEIKKTEDDYRIREKKTKLTSMYDKAVLDLQLRLNNKGVNNKVKEAELELKKLNQDANRTFNSLNESIDSIKIKLAPEQRNLNNKNNKYF